MEEGEEEEEDRSRKKEKGEEEQKDEEGEGEEVEARNTFSDFSKKQQESELGVEIQAKWKVEKHFIPKKPSVIWSSLYRRRKEECFKSFCNLITEM